jgi:hypothetical protein
MIADVFYGDAKRDFVEVMEWWAPWIKKQAGHRTVQRYACSLDQLRPWLDGKGLTDIDSRLVAEIVRVRSAAGVTNATIKRDLVALSSVINYAIDQGWCDDNPVLPRMRRIKEKRDPIVLPHRAHVDLVIARCPGMIADMGAGRDRDRRSSRGIAESTPRAYRSRPSADDFDWQGQKAARDRARSVRRLRSDVRLTGLRA